MIDEKDGLSELPEGWVCLQFAEAGQTIPTTGRKLKQSDYKLEGKLAVVDQGQSFVGGYTDKVELEVNCTPPVVVFGDHTKVVKYIDFRFVAGADGIKVIKPSQAFVPKALYYLMQAVSLPDKGYARHFQYLQKSMIPLPPLPEQHRIVTKVEELFTRLDAGVEALKKIQFQLKRYRQSVLKSAFSGELTAEWRKAHKGELEPASVLLEKIKEERNKSSKYKELPPLDTTDLPDLPERWVWARLNDLKQSIQYGTSEKANNDTTGIPIVRMGNIQDGKLVFENLKYLPHTYPQLADFILEDGDILFNRTNSAELVGKTATYRGSHLNAIFASYLIRIKVNNEVCIPDLITYFINSFYGRSYIGSVVSQQVGQANLNGTKLALMPIPLLSFAEQKKIVDEIDRHFSIADEIEATVEQSLKQADRLRQSILKKAFEGKLVPQNPDDEPAEKLLERIKAEKIKIAQKYLKE